MANRILPNLLDPIVTPSARQKTTGAPGRTGYYLVSLTIVTLSASQACAATDVKTSTEVTFFSALLALILVGRLLGEAMNRIGQPSVMGQLLAGCCQSKSA